MTAAASRDARHWREAPRRPIAFASTDLVREPAGQDTVILRAAAALPAYDFNLAHMFRAAAARAPDRVFLAERVGPDWREVTYAQARRMVDAIAAAYLARGLSPDRPVMILSGNGIDHALLVLAGFCSGVPVAPISAAYSLQSEDHERLKHITDLLKPGLIYVADTAPFARTLDVLDGAGLIEGSEIAASRNGAMLARITSFEVLAATPEDAAVEAAIAALTPDTVCKILFTSGSTGLPKGVINTHGMLAANQAQLAATWPFVHEAPPVLLDWLPWNHTFGGNHNFNMVLQQAGTLYIDNGRPVPALIGETVKNLMQVSPTIYFNVPAGYAALLPYLESDAGLAERFFAKLRLIFYAGAALPQDLWDRLETVAVRTTGERIPMTSAWGSTETGPLAASAHFPIDSAGNIGVPVPGVELKLLPNGSKSEVRVRGPNITPGYWKRPDLTAEAFDADGFYLIGDAMRFADPAEPQRGLMFDGRIAEDFKLTTGVWVHVGTVRVGALAAASPALQDMIVAGENRADLTVLCWLNVAGCRQLLGAGAPSDPAALARDPRLRAHVKAAFAHWNTEHGGSSRHIARALLLPDAPSIDANEITDKGYINQRLSRERRKADVERLYRTPYDPDVIVID